MLDLSDTFPIEVDGTIYLPRLRTLLVEELRHLLSEQFKIYLKSPELYIRAVVFYPIRTYVCGEVRWPGY